MSEWIKCSDQMPPWAYVLAYRPGAPKGNEIATLQYSPHSNGFSGRHYVTHWMPLPEPPK